MKVEADLELKKELKAQKMSPTTFISVMVVMLIFGAGVYVAVEASRPHTIDAALAEQIRQISRHFHLNRNGVEVPLKFVSGTNKVPEKVYYASIFIKFPLDLINNTTFVGRIIDLVSDEIEDAFDRETNGHKVVTADFRQPARKVFEEIIEVVYLVEFIDGTSNFDDFVMPIVNQFEYSAEHYYKLLNEFRKFGYFSAESDENNENEYEVATEPHEEVEEEKPVKAKMSPQVSLIEKLRN